MKKTFFMGQDADLSGRVRPMAVAGSFYPVAKGELQQALQVFFQKAKASGTVKDQPLALIVPHAGYVFSGQVAAEAFAQLPADGEWDHIFLLGPAHHASVEGASINRDFACYQTPLGSVPVDTALCDTLIREYPFFCCNPKAHDREHCLEVQLPFLQYRLKHVPPIVPIIIGTEYADTLQAMARALKPYFNSRNLFVISSDFSHYPTYEGAQEADGRTGEAVEKGDAAAFVKAIQTNSEAHIKGLCTSACGQSGIYILLSMMEGGEGMDIRHLDYKNSGDSPYGGKDEVVGYHAFAFYRKKEAPKEFSLTETDKQTLLHLVRQAISDHFEGKRETQVNPADLSPALRRHCGAFVTLHKQGRLRGCIGRFGEAQPLYEVVAEMAGAAAFEDPRFPQLRRSELDSIEVEISVLTPMKRINSLDEFTLGWQGIYILKGARGGTYLPQVAEETGWTKEEFVEHCAEEKAGLAPGEWRTAELYTYEAIVFHE